jgi:hypothetical protein
VNLDFQPSEPLLMPDASAAACAAEKAPLPPSSPKDPEDALAEAAAWHSDTPGRLPPPLVLDEAPASAVAPAEQQQAAGKQEEAERQLDRGNRQLCMCWCDTGAPPPALHQPSLSPNSSYSCPPEKERPPLEPPKEPDSADADAWALQADRNAPFQPSEPRDPAAASAAALAAEKAPKPSPKLKLDALAEAAASHSLVEGARRTPLPQSSKKERAAANASA